MPGSIFLTKQFCEKHARLRLITKVKPHHDHDLTRLITKVKPHHDLTRLLTKVKPHHDRVSRVSPGRDLPWKSLISESFNLKMPVFN